MPKIDERAIKLYCEDLFSLQMVAEVFGCSRQAVKKYLNKREIDTGNKKFEVICDQCGKNFKKQRSRIRNCRKNYCSTGCYYKAIHNPEYNDNRQGQRIARKVLDEVFMTMGLRLYYGWVVHHVDGNTMNNDLDNLMVFDGQSDHMQWHRAGYEKSGVRPIWTNREPAVFYVRHRDLVGINNRLDSMPNGEVFRGMHTLRVVNGRKKLAVNELQQ